MMTSKELEIRDYTTTVTILESITDAIFILNSEFIIEYANKSAQTTLQRPLENLIGSSLATFLTNLSGEGLEKETDLHLENVKAQQQDDIFGNNEAELLGLNGTIPVLVNMSTIPDSKGEIRYVIVTAKEIAYRKGLEKELKQRQALSVSFDRLKALGEMSVGLVHTLGQPVTSMELRLDHIKSLSDDQSIHEQIDHLKNDIEQLTSIVDKVRNYALVSDRRQLQALNVNDAINSSLKVLEYDLERADVDIKLELTEKSQLIHANAPELEQVLINLLANAMQAFDSQSIKGSRNISICTSMVGNKWVVVNMKDNAGGVSKALREKIFEPFFSTWEDDRHAGTGLSVARSILASLGGDLQYVPLESGSNFQLRIPATQEHEREQLFNLIELLNSE